MFFCDVFVLRSIGELQQQNQKLLEVTRDLSEKLEERETVVTDERTTELQNQLDGARKELEQMRESRERQAEMVSVSFLIGGLKYQSIIC